MTAVSDGCGFPCSSQAPFRGSLPLSLRSRLSMPSTAESYLAATTPGHLRLLRPGRSAACDSTSPRGFLPVRERESERCFNGAKKIEAGLDGFAKSSERRTRARDGAFARARARALAHGILILCKVDNVKYPRLAAREILLNPAVNLS